MEKLNCIMIVYTGKEIDSSTALKLSEIVSKLTFGNVLPSISALTEKELLKTIAKNIKHEHTIPVAHVTRRASISEEIQQSLTFISGKYKNLLKDAKYVLFTTNITTDLLLAKQRIDRGYDNLEDFALVNAVSLLATKMLNEKEQNMASKLYINETIIEIIKNVHLTHVQN